MTSLRSTLPPVLDYDHLVATPARVRVTPILQKLADYATLRYTIAINTTYVDQSVYRVEIFSTASLAWAELWTLDPYTFKAVNPSGRDDDLDPDSHYITHPMIEGPEMTSRQIQSWQKILDTLHGYAVDALA